MSSWPGLMGRLRGGQVSRSDPVRSDPARSDPRRAGTPDRRMYTLQCPIHAPVAPWPGLSGVYRRAGGLGSHEPSGRARAITGSGSPRGADPAHGDGRSEWVPVSGRPGLPTDRGRPDTEGPSAPSAHVPTGGVARSCALRPHATEGTFDLEVDRVPAGHFVAPGGGPAPIPGPPRGPARGPAR